MSTIPEIKSQTTMLHEKLAAENIIPDIQVPVVIDPIDPKRISKEPINTFMRSSLVKAGLVFLGTLGTYYLVKTTKILSCFGWGTKNSKDVDGSEIMEVKNKANILDVRRNIETIKRANGPSINRISKTYRNKDRTVEFEEIKVKEFKDLHGIKEKNLRVRRSIINPTFKGSYDTPGWAYEVALSGNYAYVADYSSGLQIIDISDPSNPTFKGSYDTPGSAFGVAVSSNYAYVTDMSSGLQIIDISDPSNPTFKGSYDMSGSATKILLSGNYAYIVDYSAGLQIIDISDPSNPTLKGSYSAASYTYGVALSGDYAYVTFYDSGLHIVDISDPSNPTFKGSYDAPSSSLEVALSGNYAYIAADSLGLQIIDISNLSNPTFKGSYDTPGYATKVVLSGDYAYIADKGSGLQIIDISNPSNPTFKGSYDTPGEAMGVTLSGNYAYVAASRSGLQIITINISTDLNILTGSEIALIVIGSIIGAVCISSFCCALIGGGIVVLRQYRKKGSENINTEESDKDVQMIIEKEES